MPCTPSRVWDAMRGKAGHRNDQGRSRPARGGAAAAARMPFVHGDRRARGQADQRAARRLARSCSPTGRSRASSAAPARRRPCGCTRRARWRPASPCCCGSCPGDGAEDDRAQDGVVVVHNPCLSGGALEIFLEPQLPAPRIVVAGDTPIARALADVGARRRLRRRARRRDRAAAATDAALIVASHGDATRRRRSRAALEAGVGYVGARGEPQARRARCSSRSTSPTRCARRSTRPPGSTSARARRATIAISILAEIVAERTRAAAPTGAGAARRDRGRPGLRDGGRGQRRDARTSTSAASASTSAARAAARRSPPSACRRVSVVAGLVLAAGGSKRLGRPKQLLPFGGATLLDHVLAPRARASSTSSLSRSAGRRRGARAGRPERRRRRRQRGLRRGLLVLDRRGDGRAGPARRLLVLMLGDQPGRDPARSRELLAGRGDAPLAVCRYDDGLGHPFASRARVFDDLRGPARRQGACGSSSTAAATTWPRCRSPGGPARRRHLGRLRGAAWRRFDRRRRA